ncbi:MAG: type II toxin-antitoxin system Phd/YefM family antitoxin [Gammaproteobacteria bacterium]|nr:type II toxin-antitoxin system Phd/YefM family antitoxin [Gammaproteobacteria bacterium]
MQKTTSITPKTWTITEAKVRLSEILHLASETGPQYIGSKKSYVVVPKEQWQALTQQKKPLGRWLAEHMAGIGEIPLPDRNETEREIPFQL